jgi:hypothetical protein
MIEFPVLKELKHQKTKILGDSTETPDCAISSGTELPFTNARAHRARRVICNLMRFRFNELWNVSLALSGDYD